MLDTYGKIKFCTSTYNTDKSNCTQNFNLTTQSQILTQTNFKFNSNTDTQNIPVSEVGMMNRKMWSGRQTSETCRNGTGV